MTKATGTKLSVEPFIKAATEALRELRVKN
jgi:hypothetical protein